MLFGESLLLAFAQVKVVGSCTRREARKLGAEERGLEGGSRSHAVIETVLNDVASVGSLVTDVGHKLRQMVESQVGFHHRWVQCGGVGECTKKEHDVPKLLDDQDELTRRAVGVGVHRIVAFPQDTARSFGRAGGQDGRPTRDFVRRPVEPSLRSAMTREVVVDITVVLQSGESTGVTHVLSSVTRFIKGMDEANVDDVAEVTGSKAIIPRSPIRQKRWNGW